LIALEVCMDKIFSPFVSRAAQGPRTDGDKLLHVSPAALRVDLERLIHCSIDLLLRQTYFSRLRIGRGRTLCRLGSRSRSGTLGIVASQNSDSHNGDCKEHKESHRFPSFVVQQQHSDADSSLFHRSCPSSLRLSPSLTPRRMHQISDSNTHEVQPDHRSSKQTHVHDVCGRRHDGRNRKDHQD